MFLTRASARMSLLVAVVSVVLGAMWQVPGVSAFAVTPVLNDRTMNPGASEQGIITVINDTENEQTYYALVQNFVPQGEEGQQTFLPETDTSGLVSWIALDRPSITLKAGEMQEFRWSLNIPTDAEPGGHYAAVFFSTRPPSEESDSSVGVGAKTGVLFLVNVNGAIQEKASIESFSLLSDPDSHDAIRTNRINHLPALFELRVKNEGNVHFIPQGEITITNVFGNTIAQMGVNPQGSRVLPGSIRKVFSSWGGLVPAGDGFMDQLKAEWAGFALGRYTASVKGSYGHQMVPFTASLSFWVFPWRIFLVAILTLIALLALLKGYNALVVRSAMSKIHKQ